MIKIGMWTVPGSMEWFKAVEGMRNPMNSWDRSDSKSKGKNGYFELGENDLGLATRLTVAGPEHRKFLRMLNAYTTITAPLYWWKEFDAYKIGVVRNSCSSMHSMLKNEFTLGDFSHDKLSDVTRGWLEQTISDLNTLRNLYLNAKDNKVKKDYWYEIIQLLPSSYMQKATVMMSFESLINMYFQRRYHKLEEWQVFCKEVKTIPWLKNLIEELEEDE